MEKYINLEKGFQVDRYKVHNIEIHIDKLTVNDGNSSGLPNQLK
jgi:hypothetical protein